MAYKTLSKKGKNKTWAEQHPSIAVAVANMRGQAGMSEDAIYRALRGSPEFKAKGLVAHPPSIRDIRAAFEEFDATHLRIAGETGRSIKFKTRQVEEGHTRYREVRKDQFSARQVAHLNRNYALYFLNQAELSSEEWSDPDAFLLWEGDHDYDYTPPF